MVILEKKCTGIFFIYIDEKLTAARASRAVLIFKKRKRAPIRLFTTITGGARYARAICTVILTIGLIVSIGSSARFACAHCTV